jgi:anaerobic selenocysteine-containing dehydrogenase
MAGTRLRRRVASAAAAAAATAGCPGPGVVGRLAAGGDPDPPPCPACGGCHVLAIDEVVVGAGDPPGEPPGP